MTATVVMALWIGGRWSDVAWLDPDDPPGSVTSDEPGGRRRLYLFGWMEGTAGVWESVAGFDIGDQELRTVHSTMLEPVGDLAEPFELTVTRVGQPIRMQIRRAGEVAPR